MFSLARGSKVRRRGDLVLHGPLVRGLNERDRMDSKLSRSDSLPPGMSVVFLLNCGTNSLGKIVARVLVRKGRRAELARALSLESKRDRLHTMGD